MFKNKDYLGSINQFKSILEMITDSKIIVQTNSMIAKCYLNLLLYEDAINFCDKALKINENHFQSLFIRAKCLS